MVDPLKDLTATDDVSRQERWNRKMCGFARMIHAEHWAFVCGLTGIGLAAAGLFTGDNEWLGYGLIVEGAGMIFAWLHCPLPRLG